MCDAGEVPPDDAPTVNRDRRDRILDWHEELVRLEPDLASLPAAARRAVQATVECFLREDGEMTTGSHVPAGYRCVHVLDDVA